MDSSNYFGPDVPTFSMEDNLPSLPLPSLKTTLHKYLDSVKPFVSDEELVYTQRLIEDFESGIGARLHEILSEKAINEKNWVIKENLRL